jgi:hypothetical protein
MASRNFFLSVSERTSDERSSDHDECPAHRRDGLLRRCVPVH